MGRAGKEHRNNLSELPKGGLKIAGLNLSLPSSMASKIAILMNKCIGNGLAINLAIRLAINLGRPK